MNKFMIHLNSGKKEFLLNENIPEMNKILSKFFPILLKSCFYVQSLGVICEKNTKEY